MLQKFRGFRATDKRDMIFRLLGMISDGDAPVLVPDYKRDVEEVYLSVTFSDAQKVWLRYFGRGWC